MTDSDIPYFVFNNQKGRCGGCSILFKKLNDGVMDDHKIYKWKGYKFCEDCYQRRLEDTPTGYRNMVMRYK